MKQKDLKEIHELLLENVREENEKQSKDLSNSQTNLNSKKDLISAAREALKPKIFRKIKNNNIPVKINRTYDKKESKKFIYKNDLLKKSLFSDKQYLNFLLSDLKLISNSMKSRQNKFNPKYSNNNNSITKKNKNNKYYSFVHTKNNNVKMMNLQINNSLRKKKYNMVNLLTQIVGDKELTENNKYENDITEDNSYFYNLCYDNNEQKVYVKDNNGDNYLIFINYNNSI
jgi:hypothetical protein